MRETFPHVIRYTQRVPLRQRSTMALFSIPKVPGVTKATAKQQMLKQLVCSDAPERALRYHGFSVIAGVDEVGRGALFGPVVAAAVILPIKLATLSRMGLKDSKQLTREQREKLDRKIRKVALCYAVAEVDAETIDRVNIYQASRLAMLQAVQRLTVQPDHLLIDAMLLNLAELSHPCAQTRLFYGDALSLSIAAASVIAKVHRDALMRELDLLHPQYGLASHKGYATPEHRQALREHGPCPLHRKSFAPVAASDPNAALDIVIESGDLFLDDPLDDDPIPPPAITATTQKSVISTEGAPAAHQSVTAHEAHHQSVISTEAKRSGETRSVLPEQPACP
jgi:ribonuclease HII